MLKYLSLLLVSLSLFASDNAETNNLAYTEFEKSSIVAGCVNAITGTYFSCHQDLVMAGPEPLALERVYTGGNCHINSMQRLWGHNHDCYLHSFKHPSHGLVAQFIDGSGSSSWHQSKGGPMLFQKQWNQRGLTNCHGQIISARTNLKHTKVGYLTVTHCSGRSLSFTKHPHSNKYTQYYNVLKDTRPSGNSFNYTYDKYGRPIYIEAKGKKPFSALALSYGPPLQPHISISGSDGRHTYYKFTDGKLYQKGLRDYNSEHYFLLTEVSAPGLYERYEYTPNLGKDGMLLSKRVMPEGRYVAIDYWGHHSNKHVINKVKAIKAPVGTDANPITVFRFEYDLKAQNGYLTDTSYTHVYDALNHRTTYQYSKYERLTGIFQYTGTGPHNLYSVERLHWADDNNLEQYSHLASKTLEDASGNVVRCRFFSYDPYGNVLEERLYGNITGLSLNPIRMQGGLPLGGEYQYKKYRYEKDTHLPLVKEDSLKKENYTYVPNTDKIAAKYTWNDNQVAFREFNTYDDNGVLICKIVDNGCKADVNDHTNCTERHITRITPRTEAPIGLPQQVIEACYDFAAKTEKQIKRTVNTHAKTGWLVRQDIYDANDQYAYSLSWQYNERGQVLAEQDALGQLTQYQYDNNGNKTAEIHPSGKIINYRYDLANRLIAEEEIADGLTLVTQHRYNHLSQKTATIDQQGNTTHYQYDDFGRLVTTVFPPIANDQGVLFSPTLKHTYDISNNITSITDGNGSATMTAYTTLGKPYYIIYPDGTSQRFTYDLQGNVIKEVAKNGSYTIHEYDYLSRDIRKSIYSPEGELLQVTTAAYDAFHLIAETDASGETTAYTYNPQGQLVLKTRADLKIAYTYDSLGRQYQQKEWYGFGEDDYLITQKTYDNLDREITETLLDHQNIPQLQKEYTYDVHGNKNTITLYTQAGLSITKNTYNQRNTLIAATDPLNNTTTTRINYHYKNEHNQTVTQQITTDPLGNTQVVIFDACKNETQTHRTDKKGNILQKQQHIFDAAGNRLKLIETVYTPGKTERQVITAWTYDKANRVISLTEAFGTPEQKTVTYTYNPNGEKERIYKADGTTLCHEYDPLGRLTRHYSSDLTIDYHYTYDALNNPIYVQDQIHGLATYKNYDQNNRLALETLGNNQTITYKYDRLGRPQTVTLPDNSYYTFTFSPHNLTQITRYDASNTPLYTHHQTNYDLNGNLLSATLPNNQEIHYTYDLANRLINSTAPTYTEDLAYDPIGNLITRNANNTPCTYQYNNLYQLTQETGLFTKSYQNDSLYNRTAKDQDNYTINNLNQILDDSRNQYTYDPNGNLIAKTGQNNCTYTYDALDRLTSVTTPAATYTYIYDHDNRRIIKQADNTTINYLYTGKDEVGTVVNNTITQFRLLGKGKGAEIGAAVAIELKNSTFIPIHDNQGNVVQLLDSAGNIVTAYRYSAFGEETSQASVILNPWRFSSKRCDEETGWYYFGRRYYSTDLGRWITPDPLGYDAGPNLYAYVLNTPMTHFDLYGLKDQANADANAPPKSQGVNNSIHQACMKVIIASVSQDIRVPVAINMIYHGNDSPAMMGSHYSVTPRTSVLENQASQATTNDQNKNSDLKHILGGVGHAVVNYGVDFILDLEEISFSIGSALFGTREGMRESFEGFKTWQRGLVDNTYCSVFSIDQSNSSYQAAHSMTATALEIAAISRMGVGMVKSACKLTSTAVEIASATKGGMLKSDLVIKETLQSKGKITSRYRLSASEALEAGEKFLGTGYREIGKSGSGVFRSSDGLRQFRIDTNSLLGKHNPWEPHVHLETYTPGKRAPNVNNHIFFNE